MDVAHPLWTKWQNRDFRQEERWIDRFFAFSSFKKEISITSLVMGKNKSVLWQFEIEWMLMKTSTGTKWHFQFSTSTQGCTNCLQTQSQYFSAFQTSCVKVKIVTQQKEIFFSSREIDYSCQRILFKLIFSNSHL